MSTLDEIENAIMNLPARQVDELAGWLEGFRKSRISQGEIEAWLRSARGAAMPGETTERIMAMTRGDDE